VVLVARIVLASTWVLALVGCPGPGRDVVPESRDVRGETRGETPDAGAGSRSSAEGYVYVARRPHGAVGLVGAHFMSDADAQHIVDRVADDLDSCARRLEQRGALVEGALSLVAVTGSRGTAEITDVRFAPGGPVAANALECIIAPLRANAFPTATKAGVPAVAIEATWGMASSANTDAGADAGKPL
jgi:hypothetical protein